MEEIIQKCYQIFDYPPPNEPLHACICPICLAPELELEMRTLPLRELRAKHFYEYNGGVIDKTQNSNEIKYFLPRMIELFAQNEELHHSLEIYFARVGYVPKSEFTATELTIWQKFADAYLDKLLTQDTDYKSIFSYLEMFHKAHIDIRPFLQRWQNNDTPQAIIHFVHASWYYYVWQQETVDTFDDDEAEYQQIMKDWLDNTEHKQHVAHQLLNLPSEIVQQYCEEYDYPDGRIDYLFDVLAA